MPIATPAPRTMTTARPENRLVSAGIAMSPVTRPNGSRLSCGRPARRRENSGRQSVPARAQHSASFKAITARQLQALVRQRAHELRSRPSKARASAPFLDGGRYGRTRAAEIVREHHRYELQVCLEPKEERLGYRRDL